MTTGRLRAALLTGDDVYEKEIAAEAEQVVALRRSIAERARDGDQVILQFRLNDPDGDKGPMLLHEFGDWWGPSHEFVPSKAEFEDLVKEIRRFYRKFSDGQIEAHNRGLVAKEIEEKIQARQEAWGRRHSPKVRKRRPGGIYVIRSQGLCKIGRSENVAKRIESYRSSLPVDFEVLYVIDSEDTAMTERRLHIHFQNKQVKREWFNLSEEDIETIKSWEWEDASPE